MKPLLILCLCLSAAMAAWGDADILLGGKVMTITNLQGRVYDSVSLERGTMDGIIYSLTNGTGGGMIKYTDVSLDVLTNLNIPTNRVETAAQRAKALAEEKARHDAAVQAMDLQQEQQALNAANAANSGYSAANANANGMYGNSNDIPTTAAPRHRRKQVP